MATQGWINCATGRFPFLYSAPIRWTLKEGVNPSEEDFDMIPAHAKFVMQQPANQPVSITISTSRGSITIKNLWVEGVRESAVRFISRIRLSDRRRFLKYGKMLGRYNIRREVGINRIAVTGADVIDPVVPDLWFAPYSLKGYAPNKDTSDLDRWGVVDMIKDVMSKATEIEYYFSGGEVPGVTLTPELQQLQSAMSFENLQIDDGCDFGILRALNHIPEAGITVAPDGTYILFSKTSGKDTYYASQLAPELENRGHITLVSNQNVRPQFVEVFFTILAELRFDYIESEDPSSDQAIPNDSRRLDNVAPSPDWTATWNGEPVVQGTWKTIDQYLQNWTPQNPWGAGGQITRLFIRQALCPYLDLWAPFLISGQHNPNVVWASRAAMLQNHFRTTFRVNPRIMNNVFEIKAERVGIVDQSTGATAPAEAYCDYYKVATQRAFWASQGQNGMNGEYLVNVSGYPKGAAAGWDPQVNQFDSNTLAVPAKVLLVDHDQGIFHLDWMSDGFRLYEMLGPSKVVRSDGGLLPSADFANAKNVSISYDALFNANIIPALADGMKLAVILSAIPAAPNDTRQLFKITVYPEDVKDMVPAAAQTSLENCQGPPWQVRIGGGMDGARAFIPWNDSRYADIDRLFGTEDGKPFIDDLVLNYQKPTQGKQGASLTTIAKTVAARIWTRYMDRYQGVATGDLKPQMQVDGWIGSVTHMIEAQGVGATVLSLPESLPEMPWYSLLDASTRAILFREVRPRK
jgi:hypothetical protein